MPTQQDINKFYYEAMAKYDARKKKIGWNKASGLQKYWAYDPKRLGHPISDSQMVGGSEAIAFSNWIVLVWDAANSTVVEWPVVGVPMESWDDV